MYYTDINDKKVEAFAAVTIQSRQDDEHYLTHIQRGMKLETAARAESLRQYLAQLANEREEEINSHRELLLCKRNPKPEGESLIRAMNEFGDVNLVSLRKYYYRAQTELSPTDWERLDAWITSQALELIAWRRQYDTEDLETVSRFASRFCTQRGY